MWANHVVTVTNEPVRGGQDTTPFGDTYLCDGYAWWCTCQSFGSGHGVRDAAVEESTQHLDVYKTRKSKMGA